MWNDMYIMCNITWVGMINVQIEYLYNYVDIRSIYMQESREGLIEI